jgi:hypothetical protein
LLRFVSLSGATLKPGFQFALSADEFGSRCSQGHFQIGNVLRGAGGFLGRASPLVVKIADKVGQPRLCRRMGGLNYRDPLLRLDSLASAAPEPDLQFALAADKFGLGGGEGRSQISNALRSVGRIRRRASALALKIADQFGQPGLLRREGGFPKCQLGLSTGDGDF